MSTKLPEAPAAPDYAKANREGIMADIETLGTRRAVDQAARLGKGVFADNRMMTQEEFTASKTFNEQKLEEARASGNADAEREATEELAKLKSAVDFTGLGDDTYARQAADLAVETNARVQREQLALREELGEKNATQTRRELEASDPTAFATREALTKRLRADLETPDEVISAYGGLGEAAGRIGALADRAPQNDGRLKELYSEAGKIDTGTDDMGQLGALQQIQAKLAMSPGSRPTLRSLQAQAAGDKGARELEMLQRRTAKDRGASPTLSALELEVMGDEGAAGEFERLRRQSAESRTPGRLGSIYDEVTRLPTEASDGSTDVLNSGLMKAYEDFQLGGKLDEDTKRNLLNDVRDGQVARGNYLGDAAALTEATELGSAAEARKAQRMQTLLDVQSRAFGQNSALRGEGDARTRDRLNRLAGLQETAFGQEQSQRGEQASFATAKAAEAARLRGERAGLATTNAAQRSALRGEQGGFASGAAAVRSGVRGEQAGFATTESGEDMTRAGQLAALAQQIFGTGAAMRGEVRGAQASRLGLMSGIAGQDFGQDQQAYTSTVNGANAFLTAQQLMAAEERAARQETLGRSQQKLANVSAMVLGQPITNQFGSLGAAQQGAVGFNPIAYRGGPEQNANAGQNAANFAQQSFGTNANMWTTKANIAQQDNAGKMSMISGGAGAAMGMV